MHSICARSVCVWFVHHSFLPGFRGLVLLIADRTVSSISILMIMQRMDGYFLLTVSGTLWIFSKCSPLQRDSVCVRKREHSKSKAWWMWLKTHLFASGSSRLKLCRLGPDKTFSNHWKPQGINLPLSSFLTSPLLSSSLLFPLLPLFSFTSPSFLIIFSLFHPFSWHLCLCSNMRCLLYFLLVLTSPIPSQFEGRCSH